VARSVLFGTVEAMIRLTRLRHADPLYLNPDHIERLDRHHDTVVHLLNGNEYLVLETPEQIVDQVTYLRARSIAMAARLAVDGVDSVRMSDIQVAAAVGPLPQVVRDDEEG
jgi:uncharacterized protein YlzI (FlbEa/FlbD family)